MKKIVTIVVVVMGLVLAGNSSQAQAKIGVISLQELLPAARDIQPISFQQPRIQRSGHDRRRTGIRRE